MSFYKIKKKYYEEVKEILLDAKKKLVQVAHQTYQNGLTPGKSGNISSKISHKNDHKVLITPSGISLKNINLENIVIVDLEGNQIEGKGKPSSELYMHLEIYKKRGEVSGIVHTHSPYATGFSFSEEKIPRFEGFGKIKQPYLNEANYAPPGSMELAKIACNGLIKEDVLILKNHGVLAIGIDLYEAALLAEFIESSAKTVFVTRVLNREPIPTHLRHSR